MKSKRVAVLIVFFAGIMILVPTVFGATNRCERRVNNSYNKLLACVTLEGVREHQAALQDIADANGGNRRSGTPGYDASVEYVADTLEAAGYKVTLNGFPFEFFPTPTLQQLAPIVGNYATGAFTGTGYGTVTAGVTPVDINLVLPRANSSGCEAGDFAGFPVGNIALIQRGTCGFNIKALNAEAAGASAVIIFNQGNDPTREGLIVGTLGGPNVVAIPVVGASFANGEALAQPGSSAYITIGAPQNITVYNVLAETRVGRRNRVIMAGAHLDSVGAGPGINDNGSGVAALLETAEQMARVNPRNKVRFAFWGAEESGLIGSTAYVNGLSAEELAQITLYLNFDMIGSPNYVFMIYDGDESDFVAPVAVPPGSAEIEDVFEKYYNRVGQPFRGTEFNGRSDYGPFIAAGIPSGGIFTGAEGVKTVGEAAIWGGTAGVQYDPCYHLACDTYANNSDLALDVNSDAVAYSVFKFAMGTADVRGKNTLNTPVVVQTAEHNHLPAK